MWGFQWGSTGVHENPTDPHKRIAELLTVFASGAKQPPPRRSPLQERPAEPKTLAAFVAVRRSLAALRPSGGSAAKWRLYGQVAALVARRFRRRDGGGVLARMPKPFASFSGGLWGSHEPHTEPHTEPHLFKQARSRRPRELRARH